MPYREAEQSAKAGKLVALEGDSNTISTQLQLLPQASNILLLPPLRDELPNAHGGGPFDPRTYIRGVHTALNQQTETARSFLQKSSAAQPRLAFANGGSIAARTACITKFCDEVTNGNVEEAEQLLESIVKGGVGELMETTELGTRKAGWNEVLVGNTESEKEVVGIELLDPASKAMEAADFLDRKTAALQIDFDARNFGGVDDVQSIDAWVSTVAHHRTSAEPQPLHRLPKSKYVHRTDGDHSSSLGDRTLPTRAFVWSSVASTRDVASSHESSTTPDLETDDGFLLSDNDTSTMHSLDLSSSRPIRHGEMSLFNVQLAHESCRGSASIRRSKSCNVKRRTPWAESSSIAYQTTSLDDLSILQASQIASKSLSGPSLERLPRTTYRRASQAETSSSASTTRPITWASSRRYTDRGTNTGEIMRVLLDRDSDKEVVPSHEPVFEVNEDMIIYIPSETEGNFLDLVIDSYIDGPPDHNAFPSTLATEKSPRTPTAYDFAPPLPVSKFAIPSVRDAQYDDFDPYRALDIDPPSPSQYSSYTEVPNHVPTAEIVPSISAPPGLDAKQLYVLQHKISGTTVELQSSFRAFLRDHLPGYESHSSHLYFAGPDAKSWNPVFSDQSIPASGTNYKTVDQIIAIGSEDGVNREFLSQITGQVEKIGAKPNGDSRSGRLDLRYLLTNAMRMIDMHSPLMASTLEPTIDARVLATLLIPELETFLATNTSIRFLIIQYAADFLPIVLALRDLMGSELMRVAGLLDSSNDSAPINVPSRLVNPFSNNAFNSTSIRRAQEDRYLKEFPNPLITNRAPERPDVPPETVPFSKANYVLTSAATEPEIQAFLATILKSIQERSPWYTPSPPPAPPVPPSPRLNKPLPPPRSSSSAPTKPPKSILSKGASGTYKHNYASSIASSVRTVTTTYTTATERSRKRERQSEKDWENFYIGSEDEDDDEYDRMVMGRRGARIVPPERPKTGDSKHIAPTKKALKWLGLA